MSVPSHRTAPVLRVALSTWPRHDRRASGDVLLATAQELIDEGGSSAGREAFGLARSGAAVRVRRVVHDCLSGPWADAAALTIIGCALIIAALVSAATGGPLDVLRTVTAPDPGGSTPFGPDGPSSVVAAAAPALIVASALGSALLAAARLRLGALVAILVAAAVFVVSYGTPSSQPTTYEAALQYGNADYPGTPLKAPSEAFVDLGGVLGLLFFVAAITACAWLAASLLRGRGAAASTGDRLPVRRLGLLAAAAIGAIVAVPALANQVGIAFDAALDIDPETSYTSPASIAAGWSTVCAVLVVGLVAALAPRRGPAAAMAAVLVGAALWIPALWLGTGVFLNSRSLPWTGLTGEDASILVFWLLTALLGCVLGAAVLRAAGRATRSTPTDSAATPAPPDEPIPA